MNIVFSSERASEYITWPPYLYSKSLPSIGKTYILVDFSISGDDNHYGVCLNEIDSGVFLAGKSDCVCSERDEQWAMRVYYWLRNSLAVDERVKATSDGHWLPPIICSLLNKEFLVDHSVIDSYAKVLELPIEFMKTTKLIDKVRAVTKFNNSYNIILPTMHSIDVGDLNRFIKNSRYSLIGIEPLQLEGESIETKALNILKASPQTLDELVVLLANANQCIIPKGGSWLAKYAELGGCSLVEL
ncbi:hypothetical protein Misp06_03621 [Microbulbifer sp. NBRC 101763]|uniref:hypothetical protein n=1 Tax=Microbulbifer sp. NBRC 101763 TaxID=1113820 RepID=UPI00309CA37B